MMDEKDRIIEELRKRVAELEQSESKLKQIEQELRKSEERYRTLFENIPDVVYSISTKDGTITSLNPAFERFTGWSREEWIGRSFLEIIHPDDLNIVAETYTPVLQGNRPPIYELRVRSKSGEYEVGEFTSMPRFDENGNVVEEFGTVRVITERKRAEEALAAERDFLNVTLRSIGDAVIAVDNDRKIQFMNKVAEELTGWTSEQAIGLPFNEVFCIIDEKTREVISDSISRVLESKQKVEIEYGTVLISKDGTERPISDSCTPLIDRDGKLRGAVMVFRDVTERRKLEAELIKADKLESIGILAGGIAHDFKNIIFGIIGNLSMAKKAKSIDKIMERLEKIEKACRRANSLTQQLLTFSKGVTPNLQTVSLTDLIKDSAEFALSGTKVKCEFHISDNLLPVNVDVDQISQVISNIVINAEQAMPDGGIVEIFAENVDISSADYLPLKPGKYVKISIKDHGIGIPAGNIPKIFDPFFTTKAKGSGLGLATSYSIIKNHGGHIDVKSEVNVGTTFFIYLPVATKRIDKGVRVAHELIRGKGKVLVMDDEEHIRELISDMLTELGYEPTTVSSGAEAIELYSKSRASGKPFDAIIMDVTMPGDIGGKGVIKQLISIDPEVKAIISSAYSDDPMIADYKNYGFKGAIVKPYRIEDLSKILSEIVNPKS